MNPKILKVIEDIDRTKEKLNKQQEILTKLERKRSELENAEIIKLVRSSCVQPQDLAAFVESIVSKRIEAPLVIPDRDVDVSTEKEGGVVTED